MVCEMRMHGGRIVTVFNRHGQPGTNTLAGQELCQSTIRYFTSSMSICLTIALAECWTNLLRIQQYVMFACVALLQARR